MVAQVTADIGPSEEGIIAEVKSFEHPGLHLLEHPALFDLEQAAHLIEGEHAAQPVTLPSGLTAD